MCGLFGLFTKKNSTGLYDLLTALAVNTEARGKDATGFTWLDKRGRMKHRKEALPSSEFVDQQYWKWMQRRLPKAVVGHCRFTTKGSPEINENNHPHVGERYSMAHNGTLKGYEYRPWTELCQTECDSEALLRVMELGDNATKGVQRIYNAFYQSDFACIVVDKKTKNVIFFRNPKRPLRVWRGKNFVAIASTEQILERSFQMAFGTDSSKVNGLEKWTPVSGTMYTLNTTTLDIAKTELFDYSPKEQQGNVVQVGSDGSTIQDVPDKVKQYQHYSNTSSKPRHKGYKVDNKGNIIYNFDS